MRGARWPGLLPLAAILAAPCPAAAQDAAGWRVDLTAYGWLAAITGDVGARNVTVPVDNSFADTWRKSDSLVALMGRAEARRGRLGLFLDALTIRTGYDGVRLGPATVDARSNLTVVEFGAAWEVSAGQGWALDALGGGRWSRVNNSLRLANGLGGESTSDWVDPLLGLRLRGALAERWVYTLRADIGGFGAGSRFAWQAAANLGYRFPLLGREATASVGYRALHQDFRSDRLIFDATMHGPLLGLTVRF